MGLSSASRLLAAAILALLTSCPSSVPEPVDTGSPTRSPAVGALVLYAITAPDAPARLETYDVATGERTLIEVDEHRRFEELIGRNLGRRQRMFGTWIGSPTGRYVAYATVNRLRVSTADDPARMTTIARASAKGLLEPFSVAWSPDERRLVYLETIPGPKPPPRTIGFPAGMNLHEVTTDGSSSRLVARSSRPFLNLIGFDHRRALVYWVETGGGGFISNLTAVSLTNGRARRIHPLPFGLPPTWLTMTTRADAAYFIRGRRIVKIALPRGESKVVYMASPGEGRIQGLGLAPDGKQLLFERRSEREDTMSAYVLSLDDGQARIAYQGEGSEPHPSSWSPDGRYLVLSGDQLCSRDFDTAALGLLDVVTGETLRIEPPEASCRGRTHPGGRGSPAIRFLSWLRV